MVWHMVSSSLSMFGTLYLDLVMFPFRFWARRAILTVYSRLAVNTMGLTR